MVFQKNSTRTWFSFDAAIRQLGGASIISTDADMQLGRGETIEDTARVLSRMVDAIMIRANRHEDVEALADAASVPVINGLSDAGHPCQILADLMTFEEHRGSLDGRTLAWIGDGNNVCASFIQAAPKFGFKLNIACPEAYAPDRLDLARAAEQQGRIEVTDDPRKAAVAGADLVIADTWVSMGDTDAEARLAALEPYQVDAPLMALAAPNALFMHCLPAHRGEEVTADVIDGPQLGGLGRSRKPHPRPEVDPGLVLRGDLSSGRRRQRGDVAAGSLGLSRAISRLVPHEPSPSTIWPPRSRSSSSPCAAVSSGWAPAIDEILTRHDYPAPVANLLGETCALAALVGASLKFEGRLIVQAQGDGPVSYVVADYDTEGALRGYCRYDAERLAEAARRRRPEAARRQGAAGRGRLHHDHRPGRRHRALSGRHADRGRDAGALRRALFRPVGADADPGAAGGRPGRRRRRPEVARRRHHAAEHRRG